MTVKIKYRYNAIDIYIFFLLLFPFWNTISVTIVTKLTFGILIIFNIYFMLIKKMNKESLMLIICMMINYIFAVYNTSFPLWNINLLFYYPFCVIYMCFISDNKEIVIKWIKSNTKYILNIVRLWTIFIGVSVFFPGCYYIKEGGGRYFGSWVADIFRLGPATFFIQCLVLIIIAETKRKKYIMYMMLPMYIYLMGSSRTYLIVGLCVIVIAWKYICKNDFKFYISLLPMGFILAIAILNSSMGTKISYTLDDSQYGDFWFRITSSRSLMWENDLTNWMNNSNWEKLVGSGLGFSFSVCGLWAHNDYLELLFSFGIIGLIEYIYIYLMFIKNMSTKRKTKKIVLGLATFAWIFNAFFNMHYTYFCSMLAYPFLWLGIKIYDEKRI